MRHKIITTDDGSHSLFVPELNEHYHSTNGAITESKHVFIEAGFRYFLNKYYVQKEEYKKQSEQEIDNLKDEKEVLQYYPEKNDDKDHQKQQHPQAAINILEIGFGTGLNTFLTLLYAKKRSVRVFYHSVELYPIEIKEAQKLNYSYLLQQLEHKELIDQNKTDELNNIFLKLHSSPWETAVKITSGFTLLKEKFDFSHPNEFKSDLLFNLIYFDAFAPEKQPDMWAQDIFNKIYSICDKNAVFTTYCAKGIVRRMLQSAGFMMERLPGPPGKREILRGNVV